ncbi:MAG: hypothetical protein U5R06_14170 [candidate division KSB1 bacterium]|nr:hypothetical protein [candidate division KSB1 bacterium]
MMIPTTQLKGRVHIAFSSSVWLYPMTLDEYVQLHAKEGIKLRKHCCEFTDAAYEVRDTANIFVFQKQ